LMGVLRRVCGFNRLPTMPAEPPPPPQQQLPEHLYEWNNDDAAPATAQELDASTTPRSPWPNVVRGAWTRARRLAYAAMVEAFMVRRPSASADECARRLAWACARPQCRSGAGGKAAAACMQVLAMVLLVSSRMLAVTSAVWSLHRHMPRLLPWRRRCVASREPAEAQPAPGEPTKTLVQI
jgi:hypothetical protein